MENWEKTVDKSNKIVYSHKTYDIHIKINHKPDSYKEEINEKDEHANAQNLCWYGRVVQRSSITVGIYTREYCEDIGCDTAKEKVKSWAKDWIKSNSEEYIKELENEVKTKLNKN